MGEELGCESGEVLDIWETSAEPTETTGAREPVRVEKLNNKLPAKQAKAISVRRSEQVREIMFVDVDGRSLLRCG